MTFEKLLAYTNERIKLLSKNHPRIQLIKNELIIDLWCDGDEVEADRVSKMTRKYRSMVGELCSA